MIIPGRRPTPRLRPTRRVRPARLPHPRRRQRNRPQPGAFFEDIRGAFLLLGAGVREARLGRSLGSVSAPALGLSIPAKKIVANVSMRSCAVYLRPGTNQRCVHEVIPNRLFATSVGDRSSRKLPSAIPSLIAVM